MKRINKLLLILLCFVAFKVDAFTEGQTFTWGPTTQYTGGGNKFLNGDVNYTGYIYHVAEGENYPIYCMDPSLATPQKLHVYRVLLDSDAYKAEDTGLIKAIEYTGTYNKDSNTADDFAKAVAVRMLVNGIYSWTNSNANSTRVSDINKAAVDAASKCDGSSNFTDLAGLKLSSTIGPLVKKHFCAGYNAYKNYSADNAIPNVAGKVKKTTTTTDGTDYIIEIKAENFNISDTVTDSRSITLKEIAGASTVYGYSYSFTADAQSANYTSHKYSDIQGKDLMDVKEFKDLLDEDNGNAAIYVAFHVAGNTGDDSSSCDSSIYLSYSFVHPDAVAGALLRADAGAKDTSNFQRFVIFAPSNDKKVAVDGCNKPCTTSKNLLPAICEDGVGSTTTTSGSTATVGKLDDNGNVVYSFREVYFSESNMDKVKSCVLGNTDEAMNSYKYVNSTTASALTNNKFCSLYCKEDYVFNLPYQKTGVANGRYFQIDLDVAGQQTCYSTTLDKSYLNAIIVELEEEAVEAYNDYLFYDYLYRTKPTEDTRFKADTCTYDSNSCNYDPGYDKDTDSYNPSCTTSSSTYEQSPSPEYNYTVKFADMEKHFIKVTVANKETGEFKVSYNANYDQEVKEKVDYRAGSNVAVFGGETNKCTTGSHTCSLNDDKTACTKTITKSNSYEYSDPVKDWEKHKDEYKAARDEALSRLQQIIDDINSNVNEYNSCTGVAGIPTYNGSDTASQAWYASYNFNPTFTYSYTEPNGDDYVEEEKWINMAISKNANYNKMIGSNIQMYADYCPVMGENATCTNGAIYTLNYDEGGLSTTTIDAKTYCIGEVGNDYSCQGTSVSEGAVNSAANLDIMKVLNFEFTDGGVTLYEGNPKQYNVTKITNIRTDASVKGHYDTPRIFYTSSPTGKVTVSDSQPENTDSENWSLVDGLPIAIKTPVGVYYYQIMIDDLGTFYSTGKVGRIYGSGSNSVSSLRGETKIRDKNDASGTNVEETTPANGYACTYQIGETDGGEGKFCIEAANSYCLCENTSEYDASKCKCYGHTESDRTNILNEVCGSGITSCSNNLSCCPGCTIACVGTCLFNSDDDEDRNGETLLEFRAVNIAELNPNNRNLGYNWNAGELTNGNYNWTSSSITNVLVAQKAGITIDEIESRATIESIDTIDVDNSTQLSSLNDYALSVTMTPTMITKIKQYNKSAESSGSYNNQTLTCYDYILSYDYKACTSGGFTWVADDVNKPTGEGTCRMQNVMCYSSFITELKEEFGDLVDTTRPSTMKNIDERESTTLIANYGSNAGGSENTYFKKLSANFDTNVSAVSGVEVKNIQNYWAIFRYDSVDINNDGVPDIGPSWR